MEDSSLGRMIGALVAPQKTFSSIARRPTVLVPLVVLVLLGIGITAMMVPKFDVEQMVRAGIEQRNVQLTSEQIDQQIEFMEKWGYVLFVGPQVIFQPAMYLVIGLTFWLAFRLGGSEMSYKASLSTSVHAMLPWALLSILALPMILTSDTIDPEELRSGGLLPSNLHMLAGDETPAAVASLLGSLDFFSLWAIILFTIGFRETAGVSTKAAAATTIGLWIVFVLGKAGFAAVMA